jgi:hypothetical protein
VILAGLKFETLKSHALTVDAVIVVVVMFVGLNVDTDNVEKLPRDTKKETDDFIPVCAISIRVVPSVDNKIAFVPPCALMIILVPNLSIYPYNDVLPNINCEVDITLDDIDVIVAAVATLRLERETFVKAKVDTFNDEKLAVVA